MSSYTRWDRAAYIERVGGRAEAERRRKALMASQTGPHSYCDHRRGRLRWSAGSRIRRRCLISVLRRALRGDVRD